MSNTKLIDRLSSSISLAEREKEDMDSASWNRQEGILISYNEAKVIVNALRLEDNQKAKDQPFHLES